MIVLVALVKEKVISGIKTRCKKMLDLLSDVSFTAKFSKLSIAG